MTEGLFRVEEWTKGGWLVRKRRVTRAEASEITVKMRIAGKYARPMPEDGQ